ncbi:MAG: putative capsid protein [Macaque stool associated virus 11]|uniref:Putative capsid protein n=1 Tax=Macaque stool associated virus 11 TaxID=2499233 RepID=A0A345MRS1_9VIRU|nr:MAG: putative capsid protein [Macaque stool associated virus 11]AXH74071.1 MAG: putative capsid protein [Macaque stool associated virus 11]
MVFVKVSETYDLSTVPNKMGVIGVHTPDASLISANWPGLLMNCKKFRYVECNVTLACASMLPADPLQIGTESGDIAPQDMFNPILYRAVSNQTMDSIEHRLADMMYAGEGSYNVNGPSVLESQDGILPLTKNHWDVYYGLLSNRHGWRTAMPQQGLSMNGLAPLVHERLYAYGVQNAIGTSNNGAVVDVLSNGTNDSGQTTIASFTNPPMVGRAHPMPSFPTVALAVRDNGVQQMNAWENLPGDTAVSSTFSKIQIDQTSMPYIPPVFVACIIMPPAKLNRLYYRMNVEWTVEFTEIRPISEIMGFSALEELGKFTYFTDYVQAKSLSTTMNTVDVASMDIEKVM